MVREKQLIFFVFFCFWELLANLYLSLVFESVEYFFFFPYKHLLNCTSNGPHDELVRQLLTFFNRNKV